MTATSMHDAMPSKFKRQLELELEMQGMGIARFREEVRKAREQGLESTTSGVLNIMQHAFEPLCASIDTWKRKCGSGNVTAGQPPFAYKFLKDIETDILAYLSLKSVMDTISAVKFLPAVTIGIATHIQNELNFKEFKQESPNHYNKVKKDVTRRTRKVSHISTVLKRSAKKDDVDLTKYSVTEKHKIGSLLLGLLIESTGIVEVYTPPRAQGKRKRKNTQVQPTTATIEWLKKNNARSEMLSPIILPMIVEPKDWTSPTDGGFWSEHINTVIVRRSNTTFLEELENTEMWEVYQSVNHLQKTKWKINPKILEIAVRCTDNKVPLGNIPAGEDAPLPPKPEDIETNKDSRWLWRKQAHKVYSDNLRTRSKYISLQKKLQVAERFRVEDELFFVYTLDFRGRVYPVQAHLNPQGDDMSKALLHFSEGKAIDDETGAWLALHGANTFGFDKVSLQDRVAWVNENEELIKQSAADPFEQQWWTTADKPWQFLAFCMEWKEMLEDPENFVSHIPVALDGSCNGLQNFSAMLRDPVGGKATNLTPTATPQDIYQTVADKVNAKLLKDIKDDVAYALCWQGFVSRKLVKRPTMTMPYGATLTGYRQQLIDEVQTWKDAGQPHPELVDGGFQECFYMAKLIQEALVESVVAAAETMEWLQQVARIISKENLPIYWKTPVGFTVKQNYRNTLGSMVRTEISGRFFNTKIATSAGNKINVRKMMAAVSPNFVHSCDAAHLMRTVNLADTNKIGALSMVHDSFGTHAADTPVLRELLRHAFVQIHKEEPLQMFYEAMLLQTTTPEIIPPPPAKGSLDLEGVLEADFFFA